MKKRLLGGLTIVLVGLMIALNACGNSTESRDRHSRVTSSESASSGIKVTPGTRKYRGFTLDNVLHSEHDGNIHYNLYIPDSYDGSKPYALYITLPGYEGLHFQGVGQNLRSEEFAFQAQRYRKNMIIAAPQLNDWDETSADQTIALTESLLDHYNINKDKVFLQGYSGGGETASRVMGKRPELYAAYLAVSTQWDGDLNVLAKSRTPVYLAVGEDDTYYGSEPLKSAYRRLRRIYSRQGLSMSEINRLVVLDVKNQSYFDRRGVSDQHAGGGTFAYDKTIMGWLFQH